MSRFIVIYSLFSSFFYAKWLHVGVDRGSKLWTSRLNRVMNHTSDVCQFKNIIFRVKKVSVCWQDREFSPVSSKTTQLNYIITSAQVFTKRRIIRINLVVLTAGVNPLCELIYGSTRFQLEVLMIVKRRRTRHISGGFLWAFSPTDSGSSGHTQRPL